MGCNVAVVFAWFLDHAGGRGDMPPAGRALAIVHEELFNFVSWEVAALADKLGSDTVAPQRYMTDST